HRIAQGYQAPHHDLISGDMEAVMPTLKRIYQESPGSRTVLGSPQTQVYLDGDHRLEVSTNGRGSSHPYRSTHFENQGSLNYGPANASLIFNGWRGANMPVSVQDNALNHPRASFTNLLAATNPTRPDTLLPAFWVELKDIPDMLRQIGRFAKQIYFLSRGVGANQLLRLVRPDHHAKDIAAMNLAIQFGWRPFVQDLWSIVTLHDSVERRRKELKRLYEGPGLLRRLVWDDYILPPVKGSRVVNSDVGSFYSTKYTSFDSVKAWGTVRWKPTYGVPPWVPTNGELRRQLTGLTLDAILLNVWEELPWSWLADWFIPIGNTLQGANRLVAGPVDACIMQQRKTEEFHEGISLPAQGFLLTTGTSKSQINMRSVMGAVSPDTPNYTASFPALGPSQLSILGSLFLTHVR
ncbi:maturation protein, partial [ssRNA phage Gerhypos.2_11]